MGEYDDVAVVKLAGDYNAAVDAVRKLVAIVADECEASYYRDNELVLNRWRDALAAGRAVIAKETKS